MGEGKLVLRRPRAPEATLEPTFADAFWTNGMSIRFTRDAAGRVDGFAIFAGRVRNLLFDRRK